MLQKEQLSSEIRKFNNEKDITFSHLREEQLSLEERETQLKEEKTKFRSIMESEHRNIISRKMKLVVSNRLQDLKSEPHVKQSDETEVGMPYCNKDQLVNVEMEALAEAFQEEELKVSHQKEQIQRMKKKLDMRKDNLRQKEKFR